MSFYAFSSILNYLDLHASSAPHSIFLCFLRFLFGSGCLWLSGISRSIAYNWSWPNMKTGVRIIHASSFYRKVHVSRKGFFFSTFFPFLLSLSIICHRFSLFVPFNFPGLSTKKHPAGKFFPFLLLCMFVSLIFASIWKVLILFVVMHVFFLIIVIFSYWFFNFVFGSFLFCRAIDEEASSRHVFSSFALMHVCFITIYFYLQGSNFVCCYACLLLNNSYF